MFHFRTTEKKVFCTLQWPGTFSMLICIFLLHWFRPTFCWQGEGCPPCITTTLVARKLHFRYKNFMKLKKMHPRQFLVPMYDIDLVWHTHQLMATTYKEDNLAYFGTFLSTNSQGELPWYWAWNYAYHTKTSTSWLMTHLLCRQQEVGKCETKELLQNNKRVNGSYIPVSESRKILQESPPKKKKHKGLISS